MCEKLGNKKDKMSAKISKMCVYIDKNLLITKQGNSNTKPVIQLQKSALGSATVTRINTASETYGRQQIILTLFPMAPAKPGRPFSPDRPGKPGRPGSPSRPDSPTNPGRPG